MSIRSRVKFPLKGAQLFCSLVRNFFMRSYFRYTHFPTRKLSIRLSITFIQNETNSKNVGLQS